MPSVPVRYSPSVEQPQPDEGETIGKLEEQFDIVQHTTAKDYGHAVRAVHAKGHAIARGTLTVKDGLAPELAQGLFARAGSYEAVARISTQPGDILDDSVNSPRGFALKLIGVSGERLPGSEGDATQDFIMVNGPVFGAPDTKKFLANLTMLAKTTDKMEGIKKALSAVLQPVEAGLKAIGMASPNIEQMGGAPPVHPLGEIYYSQTAFRYGDHIAKFALFPVSPTLTKLTGSHVQTSGRPDAIRETMNEELIEHGGTWELRVQLCRDLEKQPVEDATVEWKEADSPFQTVATLTVEPQLAWAPMESVKTEDSLAFNIWHGLAAHQPLGNINRARRGTYQHSADYRGRTNGCPMHEPKALAEVA
ncbi:catalase family protein [Sphingomonas bacterium]|uniref:catalase family protein n=1 Tax=Sphingomonas bacterium TaxID=1895847 RepID=UPI0015754602|nr:catalase family protein [Sphingomonas bacterium]